LSLLDELSILENGVHARAIHILPRVHTLFSLRQPLEHSIIAPAEEVGMLRRIGVVLATVMLLLPLQAMAQKGGRSSSHLRTECLFNHLTLLNFSERFRADPLRLQ